MYLIEKGEIIFRGNGIKKENLFVGLLKKMAFDS